MEKDLLTIAIVSYPRAEILRTRLNSEGIECILTNVNQVQGAIAAGVRVRILEKDLKLAIPIMENLFGKFQWEESDNNVVLIPVDFSDCSFKATKLGIELAFFIGARVELIHSYSSLYPYTIPYGDPFIGDSNYLYTVQIREENTQKYFEDYILQMKNEISDEIWEKTQPDFVIKGGDAEEDILNYSEKINPRVIVMGIKGEGKDDVGLIGSITSEVISRSNVPVLAIPEDSSISSIEQVKNVMYATNYDDKDFVAIEKLINLLTVFKTKISCVHVGLRKDHAWDQARLMGMKALIRKQHEGLEMECDFLEHADVLRGIEDYINNNKIDIISITTHKRNVISRIFNPGIARRMVFHSKTPVLIFHA